MKTGTKKSFYYTILIFLLPVIAFLIFTELMLRSYTVSYRSERDGKKNPLGDIEVLILGNSQAASAIDPKALSFNAFNFAHDSQSLEYHLLSTENYLPFLQKLKIVIIPVSYFSLHYTLRKAGSNPRKYNYFYTDKLSFLENFLSGIYRLSYIATFTPRLAFGIVYLNRYKVDSEKDNGFSPRQGLITGSDREKMAFGLISRHHQLIRNGDAEASLKTLESFISRLKSRNITVVLTSIPVSESYKHYEKAELQEKNRKMIDQLCKKYGCTYIDIASFNPLTDDYFSDAVHLNPKGASIVTSKLDSVIKAIHIFN